MSVNPIANYTKEITLIDRTAGTVTPIGEGNLSAVTNNLDEYHLKSETTNTGNILTDNTRITLRIDGDGTFIRTAPILTDENAKNKYVIDFQIDQNGIKSKFFRFEISQAIIQEDENFGEVLVISGRGREYFFKESFTSRPLLFRTPKQAFTERINDYQGQVGLVNPSVGSVTNNLPDDESLKQNWIPPGPVTIQRSIEEILERIALPATSGGVLRNFYWDTDADPTASRFFDVTATEFGSLPLADGDRVIVNPETFTESEQKDKVTITDSQVFKNQIILKGNGSKGCLPMDYCRYASNFEHARRRPEWDATGATSFVVGDLVQRTIDAAVSGEVKLHRFFECTVANSDLLLPEANNSKWKEDFTIYPEFIQNGSYPKGGIVYFQDVGTTTFYQVNTAQNATNAFALDVSLPDVNGNFTAFVNTQSDSNFTVFVPFSPWTNDAHLWLSNMTENSSDLAIPPSGYRGGFVDWNFVRANYSTPTAQTNEFEHITHKWVTRRNSSPPSGAELFNGQRILVGPTPIGAFVGQANKVAQYDKNVTPNVWRFSQAPTTDDVVTDLSTMKLLKYDGANWVDGWEVNANNDRTSPLHLVKEIRYIASPGNEGVLNQGLEFEFDWRLAIDGGDDNNRSSRGAWINFWYPFPRLALGGKQIGEAYGGITAPLGTFDANNLEFTSGGLFGWNRGLATEDLGRVSAISFKMKLLLENVNGNKLTQGFANMPFTFWAVDLFDRVFFFDFTLRRNDGWDTIVIPFGERAPKKTYKNRIDEVLDIAGVVPFGNFNLEEKEFIGVAFDWKFVKCWGIQWKFAYDEANRFVNNFTSTGASILSAIGQYAVGIPNNLFNPRDSTALTFEIDRAKLAIADLRYIKELYVNSENVNVGDARTEIFTKETEIDYNTAKLSAQGRRERTKFFPQTIHIRAFGDVRLRVGHRFVISGDKVPGGTQEMVVQSIKHIIDGSSYKMDIEAKRKFVLP